MTQLLKAIKLSGVYPKRCSGHTEIKFTPGINILIGPNGSGKSTILSGLLKAGNGKTPDFKPETDGAGEVIYFDTEKNNLRVQQASDKMIFAQVAMIFSSHGQSVRPMVTRGLREAVYARKDKVVALVDEPEAAMDIDGIDAFVDTMRQLLEEKPVQFVVSSHSPLVWNIPEANLIELVPGYKDRAMARFAKCL